jgi:hypothetical protein
MKPNIRIELRILAVCGVRTVAVEFWVVGWNCNVRNIDPPILPASWPTLLREQKRKQRGKGAAERAIHPCASGRRNLTVKLD